MNYLLKGMLLLILHLVSFWETTNKRHIQKDYITFEDFGAKGNGSNETAAILAALQAAKRQKLPVRLLDGKIYKFTPVQTVDITGIPAFTGQGTIDLTDAGANKGNKSLLAVFQVTGAKKSIAQNLSGLKAGQQRISIPPQQTLQKGDVLFLASSEPLPNRKRLYYAKGQRLLVESYDPASGTLTVQQPLTFDYGNACLWLNAFKPAFKVEKGLRFITSSMNFLTCFRLYYAKATISGYYKNFALTAIMYKSSDGEVIDMEADLPITDNNGYSHCVQIADMSFVTVRNSRLSGGRHVVSGCAGGLWEKEECGGKGHAGYPSEMVIDGGVYKGSGNVPNINADNATLDSHGNVQRMIVKNCTVYGGINLGADHAEISNVVIYTDGKRAFNVGSDVQPGSPWGNYIIKDVTIHTGRENKNPFFISKADVETIKLENVKTDVIPEGAVLMDFRYYSPKEVSITGGKIGNGRQENLIMTNQSTKIDLEKTNLSEKAVRRMNW